VRHVEVSSRLKPLLGEVHPPLTYDTLIFAHARMLALVRPGRAIQSLGAA
jgi:hypothetical protein